MKLRVSTSADAIKDSGGSSFISAEGIFPVTINFVSISETKNGAKQADFNITYNGNTQVIYGPIIENKDGNMNEIGLSLINKLAVIAGFEDGHELTLEEETHKVGKDNKAQDFVVISDFSGMEVLLRTQREYSKYNNEIRRALKIRNVFREDGASAAEISTGKEVGIQIEKERERYTNAPNYTDGVTPEEAEEFEEAQRNNRAKDSSATPTSKVTAKRSSLFRNAN